MRRCISYLFITFILTVTYTNGQVQLMNNNKIVNVTEQDYYYVYTEAVKIGLFGDYIRALSLFNECLKIKPYSAAVHFQISQIYYKAGDLKKAKYHSLLASKYNSENNWYLQFLAEIYELQENFDSSIFIYNKIEENNKENPSIILKLAALYETEKKYFEALKCLENIDKIIGNSKEVAIMRYRIYEKQNQSVKAYDQLKLALSMDDEDYSINGMMAEFYNKNNRRDSAYFFYSKIYPDYKEDPLVVFSLSEFLMEENNYDSTKAILIDWIANKTVSNNLKNKYIYGLLQEEKKFEKYRPVLDTILNVYYKKNNEDITVSSIYADIEFRLGNYRKSANALKKILSVDKRNYLVYEQLIYCENFIGTEDSVIKYAGQAILLFKEIPIPYLFYGSALVKKGNYDEAIEILAKGIEFVQDSSLKVNFYSLMAESYNGNLQYENSDFYYDSAILLDENNNGVKNNYAYYLAVRKERLNFAKTLSKQTLKTEPRNPTFLDTYGWILFMQERYRAAERYIKMALIYGGDSDSTILLHYSEIQRMLDRKLEAIETLKEALKYSGEEESEVIKKKLSELKLQ
jgi:tetratricopeptide (TPR) repeat protein